MNEKIIYDFLIERIGNSIGVCALMGNLYVESKLNPGLLEGSKARKMGITAAKYTAKVNSGEISRDLFSHDAAGYGLVQWTYWSRKQGLYDYAKSTGRGIGHLQMQLEYLWDEILKYKSVINALYKATDIREVSDIVALRYLKPEHTEEKYLANRAKYGERFYQQFAIKMEEGGVNTVATYKEIVTKFLTKILEIYNSNPKRREPGDGSDGYCDCIGLIIGAIRRMGLKWTGIHGSNWAARKEVEKLEKINGVNDLSVGDLVLKGCTQGMSGWDLPSRYRKGGKYYNGDLTDYYHAGTVESVSPLRIRHMSSKMTTDTKLGKWNYHGKLTILVKAAGGVTPIPVPTSGEQAYVIAQSGSTVNLRKTPSLKGALIMRVPLGTIVNIVSPGEEWCKVTYGSKTGYMMAQFLDVIGDGKGKY